MLNSNQNQILKALSHHLKPVVLLGKNGLTPSVLKEIESALLVHELIKVQLKESEEMSLDELAQSLCQSIGAELVQVKGKTATVFKKYPKNTGKKSALDG